MIVLYFYCDLSLFVFMSLLFVPVQLVPCYIPTVILFNRIYILTKPVKMENQHGRWNYLNYLRHFYFLLFIIYKALRVYINNMYIFTPTCSCAVLPVFEIIFLTSFIFKLQRPTFEYSYYFIVHICALLNLLNKIYS